MKTPIWIVLADAAAARLYESRGIGGGLQLVAEFSHPESRERESDLVSDKPGRVQQSAGGRSAMEPPTPRKKVEAEHFARQVAKALEDGLNKKSYESLVLVTPPAFLGLLRSVLNERVLKRVSATIEKDYLHLDQTDLRERLRDQLAAP